MSKRAQSRHLPIQELANLQVINRHSFDGPRMPPTITSAVGRPWEITVAGQRYRRSFKVETRLDAIAEYRQWLWQEIQSDKGAAVDALQQLKERAVAGEKIYLACSCHPQPCHGDVVKSAVEHLVERDREKELQQKPLPQGQPQPTLTQPAPAQSVAQAPKLSARAEQATKTYFRIAMIKTCACSPRVRPNDVWEHASSRLT